VTSVARREARIALIERRGRRWESPLTEFEESDETLFASEQAGGSEAQASDEASDSADETNSESEEGEPLGHEDDDDEEDHEEDDGDEEEEDDDEEEEEEEEDDDEEDDDDARRERLRKMKSRQTFNDDQQNVAIAGAVAGAITVGIVLFVLDYFELW